jgi:riboflavin biosynthesis pyrimidine reductase
VVINYRLLQADAGHPGELSDDALSDLYRHPDPGDRAWVRTNFVSTLDGAATGPDGRSGSINTPSDRLVFALQRAHADVILVGAGTVRTEHYRAVDLDPWQLELRARLGLAPYPTLAVVAGAGDLPPDLTTPPDGRAGGPVMIMTPERPDGSLPVQADDHDLEIVAFEGVGRIAPAAVLTALARRGLRRVLCEGGPRLNQALHQADLIDEICLTLSPLIIGGSAVRSTSGADLHKTFRIGHVISADDQALLLRYVRPDHAG